MNLHELGVRELSGLLAAGELSAVELVSALRRRVEAVEPKVQAFLELSGEELERRAAEIDQRRAGGGNPQGMLAGIPGGIKDNLCTLDLHTTCASRILEGYRSPYQATAVDRLFHEGALMMGKANMDEFAMGSSCEHSSCETRNPWDLRRVPGGSSGGSAVAVAACEVPFALGSDTGGSIRQPAAYCGIVGLKPTYGRVSRYGLVAFASSLDQIGPFTRTVEDAAIVLAAMAGYDPKDATSAPEPVPDYLAELGRGIRGLRVGVPGEYFGEGLQPGVRAAVEKAIDTLSELGAEVERCSLPHTEHALATYYIIAPAEASSNLARFDGVRYGFRAGGEDGIVEMYRETRGKGFGDEVKRRIMLGTYALSAGYYDAYYLRAQKVRTLIRRDFEQAFRRFDVLVTPTAPTVAFERGGVQEPIQMYMNDILTIPANMAGIPAISVPCGFPDGLPAGLQIMGRPFDEATVLRAAHAYEQVEGHFRRRPELSGQAAAVNATAKAGAASGSAAGEREGVRA